MLQHRGVCPPHGCVPASLDHQYLPCTWLRASLRHTHLTHTHSYAPPHAHTYAHVRRKTKSNCKSKSRTNPRTVRAATQRSLSPSRTCTCITGLSTSSMYLAPSTPSTHPPHTHTLIRASTCTHIRARKKQNQNQNEIHIQIQDQPTDSACCNTAESVPLTDVYLHHWTINIFNISGSEHPFDDGAFLHPSASVGPCGVCVCVFLSLAPFHGDDL